MGVENSKSKYKWIIDPIDGTVNYIHGIPMFSISLALQIDKEIYLGIILNPATNEIYFATKNKGAFLNGERIFVSSRNKIQESLFVATFSSEITKEKN